MDETYGEAVEELVAQNYPEGLRQAADRDRQKSVSWFMRDGLGQGAAGNKAATYLMLSSPTPNEAPSRGGSQTGKESSAGRPRRMGSKPQTASPAASNMQGSKQAARSIGRTPARSAVPSSDIFPLHVNVQIHISADAGAEQIESIFSAMRRYLYDNPST